VSSIADSEYKASRRAMWISNVDTSGGWLS